MKDRILLDVSFKEYRIEQRAGKRAVVWRHGEVVGSWVDNLTLAAGYEIDALREALASAQVLLSTTGNAMDQKEWLAALEAFESKVSELLPTTSEGAENE